MAGDILNDAVAWLTDRLHTHASRPVIYSRGSDSVSVQAIIGQTVFETTDDYNVVIQVRSRDYLIRADALVIGGAQTLPQRGDRITEDGHIYESLSIANEPHYRFCDPYRTLLRIHTKQIG